MRINKLSFTLLASACLLSACWEKNADTENSIRYDEGGISFDYPGNWEITENVTNEDYQYLFIEAPGDAILKIEIYPEELSGDLSWFVELEIEAFREAVPKIAKLGQHKEEVEIKKTINGRELDGYRYEFDISVLGMDVPHVQEFFTFGSQSHSAYVVTQVASEDLDKVENGFEQVLATFNIE